MCFLHQPVFCTVDTKLEIQVLLSGAFYLSVTRPHSLFLLLMTRIHAHTHTAWRVNFRHSFYHYIFLAFCFLIAVANNFSD